jgi:molybdopterin converting factor small subunit
MYAVNMEYIEKEKEHETIIKNKEVAIIPPVSGG